MRRQRLCLLAIVFSGLAAIAFVIFGRELYLSAQLAHSRELQIHAVVCVADVIETFVRASGHLPTSWEDLDGVKVPVRSRSLYRWPDNAPELRRMVHVRFDLTPEVLAGRQMSEYVVATQESVSYDQYLDSLRDAVNAVE